MSVCVVVKTVVRLYHERFACEDWEASDEKTHSALFTSVRRLSLGVGGAKLPRPTCPTYVVRCHALSSVLGAKLGRIKLSRLSQSPFGNYGTRTNRRSMSRIMARKIYVSLVAHS